MTILRREKSVTLFCLDNNRKTILRNVLIYIGVVIFCIIFGIVYEFYSHGVVSNYMLFGFLFPLTLGLFPYFVLLVSKSNKGPSDLTSCIYNAGVATLTVGSYFKGMLDIYGTTRDVYVVIYFALGIVLLVVGLFLYIISLVKSSGRIKK